MCYANEPLTICKSRLTETVCRLKTKMMKGPVLVTSNWIIPLDPIKLQVSSARGAESLQDEKTSWCSSMNYDCDGGVTWFTTTFPNLHTSWILWKFPEKVKRRSAAVYANLSVCKWAGDAKREFRRFRIANRPMRSIHSRNMRALMRSEVVALPAARWQPRRNCIIHPQDPESEAGKWISWIFHVLVLVLHVPCLTARYVCRSS